MTFSEMKWTREPESCRIEADRIEITTKPHTDLWQRTYYHFRNDNAPALQMETEEKTSSVRFSTPGNGIFVTLSGFSLLSTATPYLPLLNGMAGPNVAYRPQSVPSRPASLTLPERGTMLSTS